MKFPVKEDFILGFIILVKPLLKTTLMSILFLCILIIFGISRNVYVPHSGHSLHARAARIEILSWLNSHSSHPSMLVGDFNLPTEKLGNLLPKFSN